MTQPLSTESKQAGFAGALGLSPQDVARLISEDSPAARIDVIEKVALEHAAHQLADNERELAQQIFRILMRDTEVRVRAALSQAIKADSQLPRDVVLHLAYDVPDVSLPMIEHSDVLSPSDLIGIIRTSNDEPERQIAIARRRHVPEPVSSALVETGHAEVVSHLVNNAGADISESGYQAIISAFPTHEKIAAAIAQRNLPLTLVENLLHHATDKVGTELRKKYQLGEGQIRADTERTRELATLRLLDGNVSTQDVERLVEQMHAHNRITPSLILTALCRGNLEFFEAVMARLASIPMRNTRLLIQDKGELGFKALYEKANLPESLQKATRIVLRALLDMKTESGTANAPHNANRLVERVLAYADGQEVENLSYIIALIRQNNLH
jgi:uncharacterized protein (DUF2336 family)